VKLASSAAAEINHFSELRISVRGSRMAVDRDGEEMRSTTAASAVPLPIASMAVGHEVLGVPHPGRAGERREWRQRAQRELYHRYHRKIRVETYSAGRTERAVGVGMVWPGMGLLPLFVTGGVGTQPLTSFTATQIHGLLNADPRVARAGNLGWDGNWVARMLEEGVTATWGRGRRAVRNVVRAREQSARSLLGGRQLRRELL
jgi:hypothetical protein